MLRRYPVYMDSGVWWLGKVPEHWAQLPGKACYREKKTSNAGMRESKVLSLSYGKIVVKPTDTLHGLVPESFETYQIVEAGDIIVRPTDLQNDWNSLRFALSLERGIITSAYMCLRTRAVITPEFGHLLLHAYDLKKVFYGLGSGLRQNLDWRDFRYLPCPVPPLLEQSAIVRYLGHMDRRIRRYIRVKQKLIALLNEQKQAIIQSVVTCGLDPDVCLRPSGVEWLGDVPRHWEVLSLGAASVSIQTGPFGSQLHSAEYVAGGIPVINPSHMREGLIRADVNVAVSLERAEELKRHQLQVGDIVAARRGELGRCALVMEGQQGWLCGTGSARIRPRPDVFEPAYLVQLLGSSGVRDMLSLFSIGATMDNLNASMMSRLRLPVPPLSEQRLIMQCILQESRFLEAACAAAERGVSLLREYGVRLVADVVTGKLDVREAAAQLPDEVEEQEPLDDTDALAQDDEATEEGDLDATLEEAEI